MAIMIGTTVASEAEAHKIAAACVGNGIAACAHIDEINSYFYWDDAVQVEAEYRIFLKTSDTSYDSVATEIRRHHSYDEPAIFCVPITKGSPSYLHWIEENSTKK